MKKNLPIVESDKEDSELESDNEINATEQNSDTKNKKRPVIVNDKNLSGNIIQSRYLFFTRKDALSYFVTTDGEAFDAGTRQLVDRRELPYFHDLQMGVGSVCKRGSRYHFALPVSNNSEEGPSLTLKYIKTDLSSFRRLLAEMRIRSVSLSKTEIIGNVPWAHVATELHLAFLWSLTKIIVCHNIIRYPTRDVREDIMKEMHSSAIGGHRGVTKTYNRIRQHYFWENMKTDIQKFIQQCLQCQLKKCVGIKTKQPMVITDTPGTAFDKIAMDIVGPLPRTIKDNEYILTIQDQLSKYCVAIPLPDATATAIADALVKRFICVFGPPKAILTDQGRNFLSGLMKRVATRFRITKVRTTAFHPQSLDRSKDCITLWGNT